MHFQSWSVWKGIDPFTKRAVAWQQSEQQCFIGIICILRALKVASVSLCSTAVWLHSRTCVQSCRVLKECSVSVLK